MDAAVCPDDGYIFEKVKKKRETNDPSPEQFWSVMKDVEKICKLKAENSAWGAKRIKEELGISMGETSVRKYVSNFIYDIDTESTFYRSSKVSEVHRRVLSKDQLIVEIQRNHNVDHRKSDAIYETIRKTFFPVTRENVRLLFKQHVECSKCLAAVDLPKTERTRRPIPASYPNSRWQMDLKKMPPCRGFNYICNIVDCYSRFAFGACLKQKTAKEVSDVLLRFIYLFGPPRILQTDNGKEFNNADLSAVMDEFKTRHVNGRPYHPQSQGRVERFNRTVVAYFRTQFVDTRDWPHNLEEFYYKYNNRVHKSTKPMTPHQMFFKRPNFSVVVEEQIAMCNLTREEREFLEKAHLDVDEDDADEQSNDKKDNEIDSNNTDSESNHANQNIISTQLPITSTSDDEATVTTGDLNKLPLDLSPLPRESTKPLQDVTNTQVMRTAQQMQVITGDLDKLPLDLSPLPRESTKPLQDVTNSQVIRNVQQMQSGVSPYYKDLYNRLFQYPAVSNKRRYSDSMCSMKENSDHWNNDLYPLELFPKKPATVATLQKFEPAVDDIVDFKPNSALSAGTNVFLSGYWRKGRVTKVDMDDSKGKVYTVEDCENYKIHLLSKYLIRPNML